MISQAADALMLFSQSNLNFNIFGLKLSDLFRIQPLDYLDKKLKAFTTPRTLCIRSSVSVQQKKRADLFIFIYEGITVMHAGSRMCTAPSFLFCHCFDSEYY